MALAVWNAEGVADGTAIGSGNTSGLSGTPTVNGAGAYAKITSVSAMSGLVGYDLNVVASNTTIVRPNGFASSLTMAFRFLWTPVAVGGTRPWFAPRGTGNALRLWVTSAGVITCIDAGATSTTGPTVTIGTAYDVTLLMTVATATTGSYTLVVRTKSGAQVGSTVTVSNANLGTAVISAFDIGCSDTAAVAVHWYYDDIRAEDGRTTQWATPSIIGAPSATSSATGTLRTVRSAAGTASGVSAASGAAAAAHPAAGAASGVSSATGASHPIRRVAGSASAASSASGSSSRLAALTASGFGSGASSASGKFLVSRKAAAAASAASSASGTVRRLAGTSGAAQAASSAAGTFRVARKATGSASAASSATGTVSRRAALAATGAASVVTSASGSVRAVRKAFGSASVVSSAAGRVQAVKRASGAASAGTSAFGGTRSAYRVAGSAVGVSAATGTAHLPNGPRHNITVIGHIGTRRYGARIGSQRWTGVLT